jgi:hypothetical protein
MDRSEKFRPDVIPIGVVAPLEHPEGAAHK